MSNSKGSLLECLGSRGCPKIPGRNLRRLDLRREEYYENFGATTLTYRINQNFEPTNVATHNSDTQQVIDFAKQSLESILREGLRDVNDRIRDTRAIVHIYLTCPGLDRDFVFNRSGPEKMTLGNLLRSNRNIEAVVHEFSKIIQSGKTVMLQEGCTLKFCVYEPPEGWVGSDDEDVEGEEHGDYEDTRSSSNIDFLCL